MRLFLYKMAFWLCCVVFVWSLLFGIYIQFQPVEKIMSRIGMEWYLFIHYWYVWATMLLSMMGAYIAYSKWDEEGEKQAWEKAKEKLGNPPE